MCTELPSHSASMEQVLFEETSRRGVRRLVFSLTNDVSNLLGEDSRAAEPQVSGFGHSCSANLRPLWEGVEGGREPPPTDKTALS